MWGGRWEVRRFTEIDSTNSYLKAQARSAVPEGLVAVADHQTAGRGRLDRRWEAPRGASLLMSVLLRPELAPEQLHLCTAAVALAATEACDQVTGLRPAVKWPNDLLLGEGKVAGVLAEAEFEGPDVRSVVVGIGINLSWPGPPGVGGTCLDQHRPGSVPTDRDQLLDALLAALAPRRALLDTEAGRLGLALELRTSCATLGRQVRVELPAETLTGLASGIDDAGHLVLETPAGIRTIAAGDVVHLRDG
jgi:BirA family transcriptional regulator, biotin operon repressor / biotin---[acetyl-CoA-carboxylase] ligase